MDKTFFFQCLSLHGARRTAHGVCVHPTGYDESIHGAFFNCSVTHGVVHVLGLAVALETIKGE